MSTKWFLGLGSLVTGVALLVGVAGCEGTGTPDTGNLDAYFANNPFVSDPRDPTSPHDLVVTPATAMISYLGQAVSLTVKGGHPAYHWDVVNGNGTIVGSPGDGGQAIYTASTVAENSIIVYDSQGHSAISYISSVATNALTIAPASVTLTNNAAIAVFTAGNGRPPYNWSLLNGNGVLNASSGTSVIYTRSVAGDNAVTVTDSAGGTASAVISQP